MKAIYKREMLNYFTSPIGYVFVGVFMFLSGFLFRSVMFDSVQKIGNVNEILPSCMMVLLLLLPLITMRLFAEERANKTEQLLLTAPIKVSEIVIGKYLAAMSVFLLSVATTLPYLVISAIYSSVHWGEIFSSYLGYFFLGAIFVAIGLFISCLTESQVLAAVLTYGITFLLFFLSEVDINIPVIKEIWSYFQVASYCDSFYRGVLTPSAIVYYLSFTVLMLFLSVRRIESRRWR